MTEKTLREAAPPMPGHPEPHTCGTTFCSCIECLFDKPAKPMTWDEKLKFLDEWANK